MKQNGERGAIVVESTWCILLALFVCLFFISYGFMLYQHALVTIVANDVAEEISHTYKLKSVTDIEHVTSNDVSSVGKYRYLFFGNQFDSANDTKAEKLAEQRLGSAALAKKDGKLTVTVDKITDDIGRYHLKVTVKQRYNFLFGDLLSILGQSEVEMAEASVNVVGTDMLFYSNSLRTTKFLLDMLSEHSDFKFINSIFTFFGKLFNLGC